MFGEALHRSFTSVLDGSCLSAFPSSEFIFLCSQRGRNNEHPASQTGDDHFGADEDTQRKRTQKNSREDQRDPQHEKTRKECKRGREREKERERERERVKGNYTAVHVLGSRSRR